MYWKVANRQQTNFRLKTQSERLATLITSDILKCNLWNATNNISNCWLLTLQLGMKF